MSAWDHLQLKAEVKARSHSLLHMTEYIQKYTEYFTENLKILKSLIMVCLIWFAHAFASAA